jgi:hypothetical protein
MDVVRHSLGLLTPQLGADPIDSAKEHFALGAQSLKGRAVKLPMYLMVLSNQIQRTDMTCKSEMSVSYQPSARISLGMESA